MMYTRAASWPALSTEPSLALAQRIVLPFQAVLEYRWGAR